MADDKRTYDLTAITPAELSTLLSSLALDIDDPSLSAAESKKLLLTDLLISSVITSNSNNYQAITQKAFYDSVATESNNGVVKHASPAQNDAGAVGNYVVIASELKRKLNEVMSGSLTPDGHWDFGAGLQIRWGRVISTQDTNQSFNFSKPFDNACLAVIPDVPIGNATVVSTTGFVFNRLDEVNNAIYMYYIAIGY